MDIADFKAKFHNLDGKNIGEKRKHLFLLIKNPPTDHSALIASIIPQNYLEKHFKLEIALGLQSFPDVLQTLGSEDEVLQYKLLKNKWFCKKLAAFLDESSSGFAGNILPRTSFVVRKKIITKLGLYGAKLDDLYDEICFRYGRHVANNLLVGCSATKIENELKGGGIRLSPPQAMVLYQKSPKLFFVYAKKDHFSNADNCVFSYIARRDLDGFMDLMQEFDSTVTLGKRLTRKIVANHKNLVIEKATKFTRILHFKSIKKMLSGEDFKKFVFSCFPKTFDELISHHGFYDLKKKLGLSQYYQILSEALSELYNKSIYDFPKLVDERMMENMDDVKEREKWIKIKLQTGPETDFIQFMKITDSIYILKHKINVTSAVHSREELICQLVETCKINHDFFALSEVLEYVFTRHRNDDESILRSFLHRIEHLFKLEELEERHWELINSILKLLERNKTGDNSYFTFNFVWKYTEFLFKKNRINDQQVIEFLKTQRNCHRYHEINNEDFEKFLLLKKIELAPKLVRNDHPIEYNDMQIMKRIIEWNKKHPKNKIDIFDHPRLIESFRKVIAEAKNPDHFLPLDNLRQITETIICTKEKSELQNQTIEDYFRVNFRYYNLTVDLWLLKFEPELILSHFDRFVEHLLTSYHPDIEIFTYLKKYATLADKTISYCVEKMNNCEEINRVFHILVMLMPTEKYLEIIAPFFPSEVDKIDLDSSKERKKGQIGIAIAKSLKYASSSLVLPTLLRYCKGDFLRDSLESLYYLFYHLPEDKLSTFITDLSLKAVSVRKHAIFLTCIVGTVKDVKNLLQKFIEDERNVSVQKHLFTATLKYFIKNPSDEFWEFVKVCMMNLDKNDKESFDLLVRVGGIPEKYRARHVIFVWDILKKSGDSLKNRSSRLISSIPNEVYKDFPLPFILEVVRDNFLKTTSVDSFVVYSLIETNYSNEILDTIFGIMRQEKHSRSEIFNFVGHITAILRSQNNPENYQTLQNFSERWHDLFGVTEAVVPHLKISFALLYLKAKSDSSVFGNYVGELLEGLVTKYGILVVEVFASELKDLLASCGESENYFGLCLAFLERKNLVFYLLTIKLLPSQEPSEEKAKKVYYKIIEELRQVPEEPVQMLLNLYLTNLE